MPRKTKKPVVSTKKKMVLLTVIAAVIIVTITVTSIFVSAANNNIRKDRILAIYNSLKLDTTKYIPMTQNVFGDKREYEWDSSRSQSSSETFVRSANVDTTLTELKKTISGAGFAYFEEPYPNELHFESQKGEYIRLRVSSKLRDDAFFNRYHMGLSTTGIDINPNAGPSSVTIKVNLDDNNE